MSALLNIEFHAGEEIGNACREAIRIANMLRVTVVFQFNGVTVMAKPGACWIELSELWARALVSKQQIKIVCAQPKQAASGGQPT